MRRAEQCPAPLVHAQATTPRDHESTRVHERSTTVTVFTAEDYPVLEPGNYEATFDRTEESEEPGQYGYWIDWHFAATTPDGVVDVMGRSSLPDRWTRATKARTWYEAIAGRELGKGEAADTDKLKGSPVTLTLSVKETEKGDERNSIVGIRRRGTSAPAAVAAPAADPEYEAWKAAQAAEQAAVVAANAEQPPPPTESPAELVTETEAA